MLTNPLITCRWILIVMFAAMFGSRGVEGEPMTKSPDESATCASYDTKIRWVTPIEGAADQARRDGKLLMVMHLSGNFAKEQFT